MDTRVIQNTLSKIGQVAQQKFGQAFNTVNPWGDTNTKQAGNQNAWTNTANNISNYRVKPNLPTFGQSAQNAWKNNLFQQMASVPKTPAGNVVRPFGQAAGGVFSGLSFGTVNPVTAKPQNRIEQGANIAGNVMGMFNPVGFGAKVLTPIGMGVERAVTRGLVRKGMGNGLVRKVAPVLVGEIAQTGAMMGLRDTAGQQFNPTEDLAYGVGFRGLLGGAGKLLKGLSGYSPRAFNIHPDDQAVMKDFVSRVQSGGAQMNLGKHGLDIQRLADHYVGKKAKDLSNTQLAKVFDSLLSNAAIRRGEDAIQTPFPKMGIAGNNQVNSGLSNIERRVIAENGLTNNPKEAAFITSTGDWIDGSGKNQGGMAGKRSLDHREIANATDDKDISSPTDRMVKYMNENNNIRVAINGNELNIDTLRPLNNSQYKSLELLARGKKIIADITKPNTTVAASGEFNNVTEYKNFVDKYFSDAPIGTGNININNLPKGDASKVKGMGFVQEGQPKKIADILQPKPAVNAGNVIKQYAPEEWTSLKRPKLELLKGETIDQAIARKVYESRLPQPTIGEVKPNVLPLSAEGMVKNGKIRISNLPTQVEIKNRAETNAGNPDLFTQRQDKLIKARVINKNKQIAPEDVLNELRGAIQSGDIEGSKALYRNMSDDFILPKFENLQKEVDDYTSGIMQEAQREVGQSKRADYQPIVNKMKTLLSVRGESPNGSGTLFREHIPSKVFGQSSDEVADALGMTEKEFMEKITQGIKMQGKIPIKPAVPMGRMGQELARLDKSISARKEFNQYFNPVKNEGKLTSVSVEATPQTKEVVRLKEQQNIAKENMREFEEYKKALHQQLGVKSTTQAVDDIAKIIQEATDTGYRARNPITVKQKVGILDYLRTPDRILKKIGLENESDNLRKAYESYQQELPPQINKITQWSNQLPKGSEVEIFRYLDGQGQTLNPQQLKVANEIKTYLGEWAERLGLPKEKRITNYITHIFDPNVIQKEFDPEFASLIRDKVAGSVYDPFVQQRLGKQGYIEDAWRALDAYTKRAVRKANMDPVLKVIKQKAEYLEDSQYKYVKNYIDRINMRPTAIDNAIDNTIKQIFGYKFGQRPTTMLTQKMRQAVYRGTLGLNIGSALRNLTQGANTYAKLGEKYTLIGYTKMAKALMTKDQEMYRVRALQNDLIEDRTINATHKFWEKLDKGLWVFFDTVEKMNRGAAYYGAKTKAINKGMNENQAIEYAKKMVRDTQFTFGSIDTPQVLQSDLAKTLLQFQSYNLKQTEFLGEMIKNKEFAGLVRYGLAGFVVINTIGQAIGMKPQDFVPFFSIFTGQSKFGETPPVQLGKEIAGGLINSPDEYGQPVTPGERLKRIGSKLVPFIPAGVQGKKLIEGHSAFEKGYTETDTGRVKYPIKKTPLNELRVSLFGKNQTSEARDYYDTKKSPLGEKQSEIYKQLGDEDKKDYIDSIYKLRGNKKLIEEIKKGLDEGKNVDDLIKQVGAAEKTTDVRSIFEAKAKEDIAKAKAKINNEITFINNKIIYGDKGSAKTINLNPPTTGKGIHAFTNQNWSYNKALAVYGANLSQEQKDQAYQVLGIDPSGLEYSDKAKQSNDVKLQYIASQNLDHKTLLERMLTGRVVSDLGDQFATDGVLKGLVETGKLTQAEANYFKQLKLDKTGKSLVIGKGKGKKIKVIKVPKLKISKPKKLKIKKVKLTPIKFAPQGTKNVQRVELKI